jgi:hypothetical protein
MVLELGVAKNSDEYFAAIQLFRKSYNRHIFCHYDTLKRSWVSCREPVGSDLMLA